MQKISMSHEDYLEAIIMLGGTVDNPIRSVDVSKQMGVSKASVNKAVGLLKERGLVDLRDTYIDVKDICAPVHLSGTYAQDMLDIVLTKSFLELLLTRRIDPLSYKDRSLTKLYRPCVGTYYRPALIRNGHGCDISSLLICGTDIVGSSSAASACDTYA